MPYFKTTEQFVSRPFALLTPEQMSNERMFCAKSGIHHGWHVGGINDDGALAAEDINGLGHERCLRLAQSTAAAASSTSSRICRRCGRRRASRVGRRRQPVVVVRAWNADARALRSVGSQKLRVVTARRRGATRRRRIVQIRNRAFDRSEQNRRVGTGCRHRSRRVLVRSDRHDPYRLMRPVVGRRPTSIVSIAGFTTDPAVSVPTFAAQKFAAVPTPNSIHRCRVRGGRRCGRARVGRGS